MNIRVNMHNIVVFQKATLIKCTKTSEKLYGSSILINGEYELTFFDRQELRKEWYAIKNALKKGAKYYCINAYKNLEKAEGWLE